MNELQAILLGVFVVLALAVRSLLNQNRVLVGVVEMWRRRCEERAARIASLEQRVLWLQSELGATEDAAAEREL